MIFHLHNNLCPCYQFGFHYYLTLIVLNSSSTGSEKNTITSETPVGAFDDKLGIVSSVNGCAETNGTRI